MPAATKSTDVRLTPWTGSKHPTLSNITQIMRGNGLRPYKWQTQPNQRFTLRSHGYDKVLYLIDGSMEIILPDVNQRISLRAGDRVAIPARVRHGSITGNKGATCLEAAVRQRR